MVVCLDEMIEDLWSPGSKRGLIQRTPRSFNDQHTEFEKHRTWVNGEADGPHCISSCKHDRCFGLSRGDSVRMEVMMSHCILPLLHLWRWDTEVPGTDEKGCLQEPMNRQNWQVLLGRGLRKKRKLDSFLCCQCDGVSRWQPHFII